MLRTINRHDGYAVQKVTNIRGETIRYQTVLESSIGNTQAVKTFATLKDAKQDIGAPLSRATYRAVRK